MTEARDCTTNSGVPPLSCPFANLWGQRYVCVCGGGCFREGGGLGGGMMYPAHTVRAKAKDVVKQCCTQNEYVAWRGVVKHQP